MRKTAVYFISVLFIVIMVGGCEGCKSGFPWQRNNLLVNPGFEEGNKGWFWMDWSNAWLPFEISDKVAHSGKKSAYLKLDEIKERSEKVCGVVQTLKPAKFPRIASGWYRVENWHRGVPRQYLQFVVIAWEGYAGFVNYQLRYVLAGVTTQPLPMINARYTILAKTAEPEQNKWIYFEVPIRDDYQKLWGHVPDNYEKLNFFFEARYDDTLDGETTHVRADVYYDDLYVGE